MLFTAISCSQESPTVVPDPASQSYSANAPGDKLPQFVGSYPENLDTDIPVDTDIVLVFSKPIDMAKIDTSTVIITDGVTPVTNFNKSSPNSGRTVILDITTPANLTNGTIYTITLTTGIKDPDNNELASGTSWTFTTAASTATVEAPRVIAATRYPSAGATGVSVSTNYVEVTFTRDMLWPDISWTTTNYSIFPDVSNTITQTSSSTYRLTLNTPLAYNTPYTVDLTNSIMDSTGTPLDEDGNDTWTFTTEADPAPAGVVTIPSLWIDSVSDTGAVISFTTSKPVAPANCYVLHDTVTPVTTGSTAVQESGATALTTVHTVTIPAVPFTPSTRYYIRAGVDTGGGLPVEILSATELTIYTKTNTSGTVNEIVSVAGGDQTGFVTVQLTDGTGYAFWLDSGTGDIYGEFFGNTTPAGKWGPQIPPPPFGAKVNTAGNIKKVTAISDGFSDAVVIYQDNLNSLYARDIHDSAGVFTPRWAEASLGVTIKAGSSFSACLVHERPTVITSGVADMPNNGTANPLLYDRDIDFTTLGLVNNDILVWLRLGVWNNATIQNSDSYNIFKYVIRNTTLTAFTTSLGAYNYYLANQTPTVAAGTVDAINADPKIFDASDAALALVNSGDIIDCNGIWAIITAISVTVAPTYQITTDVNHGLAVSDTYTVYPKISGPHTSEAVTNPLWDEVPSVPFNPGTTVKEDDYVINENNNTAIATSAQVLTPNLALDTNYALRLSADIMNNGDNYAIVRLPASATYRAVGYSSGTTDFTLTDSKSDFVTDGVSTGDIVFNIDSNVSAMVTATAATQLTLTADVFNATNEKAIVYAERGFLVAYIDNNDYVLARSFNIADGSSLGAAFAVCTNGTNNNPVAVSDGAGNAIVFYERGGNIYVKKVSATGAFMWGAPASNAAEAGIDLLLPGYTIVQALPDSATGGVGGAFLLADNGTGGVRLVRVNGATGGITFTQIVTNTGSDPHMATDTTGGAGDRVIIAYRNSHVIATGTYYHIEAISYTIGGGVSFGPINITSITADYHCEQPHVAIADSAAGTSQFYVSWFDGRYIAFIGYSLYAQQYSAAGAPQWANEVFISSPGSAGYLNTLLLGLLYWDDDGIANPPFGIIPIWLDYRNKGVTGTDIYYENVDDAGSF